MLEIRLLTGSDRAPWEALTRGKDAYFDTERADDDYDRTFRRLLDDGPTRGIAAWLDGRMVGNAHYLFHASIWYSGKCYLADLFVEEGVRRQGIATAMIEWMARDAAEHGFPSLYWNTMADVPARALYDRIARTDEGFLTYIYRRPTQS